MPFDPREILWIFRDLDNDPDEPLWHLRLVMGMSLSLGQGSVGFGRRCRSSKQSMWDLVGYEL